MIDWDKYSERMDSANKWATIALIISMCSLAFACISYWVGK